MKASEILRKLADVVAAAEGGDANVQEPAQHAPQNVSTVELTPVNANNTDTSQSGTFVPPLQAKLELLKKAVDVDSVYDQHGPGEELTGHGADNEDELTQMKKMAGIHPAVLDAAADDEPLE